MRRKWVILGAVVLLGLVAWMVAQGNRSVYPFEAVTTALESRGPILHVITEGRIEMPVFRKRADPLGLQAAISWFKYDLLGFDAYAGRGSWSYSVFFSSNGTGYTRISLFGVDGGIHEVVICPTAKVPEDASGIQAMLLKKFPGLQCKIEASSP